VASRGLPPYPTGWYAVALSSEVPPGAVLNRPFMGGGLVVYRTRSGAVRAVDPYCPHLGAHLGHGGRVDGELLVCPFHSFAYDASGVCVRTGYGTRPPARARLVQRQVREGNGLLLAWHGAESPAWTVPDLDRDGWTASRCRRFVLRDHPQETTENSVDLGHFAIVHGYRNVRMLREPVMDGPYLSTAYGVELAFPWTRRTLTFTFETEIYGLGYSQVNVRVPRFDLDARLWVLPTPIDEQRLTLCLAASVRVEPRRLPAHPAVDAALTDLVLQGFARGARQDFPIWENKRYLERPALAAGDGPIGLYRRWARQFYSESAGAEEAPTAAGAVAAPAWVASS
jgi:nitrite reductase/ring-hydroxylating ferredoxin subunit